MRTSSRAIIAGAIALTASCCLLFVQLGAERELVAAERGARARQAVELAALARERDALEREVRRLRRVTAAAPDALRVQGHSASPSRSSTQAGPETAPLARTRDAIPQGLRRVGLLRAHADLVRAMRLSPGEAKQLIDLLMRLDEDALSVELGKPPDPEMLRQGLHELEKKKDAAIVELLGSERAGQYRAYRDSRAQRAELQLIGEHLELLGTPLDPEQQKTLLGILREESGRSASPGSSLQDDEGELALLSQSQAETQRRIHERAAQLLDPEQVEHLADYYALHTLGGAGPDLGANLPGAREFGSTALPLSR